MLLLWSLPFSNNTELLLTDVKLTRTVRAAQTMGSLQFSVGHYNAWDNGHTPKLAEPQIIRSDSYSSAFLRDYFKP